MQHPVTTLPAIARTLAMAFALVAAAPSMAQSHTPLETVDSPDAAAVPYAPRYLLMATNGRTVTTETFRGRLQLIAFGFVSCPDVCPTTLQEMKQVLDALGPRAEHLQPLFVTVDPQRDTVQVLGAYTEAFDSRILGLTGPQELIRRAADSFKVQFAKVQEPGALPNVYTMDHTAGMFLLGPDGTLVAKFGYGAAVADVTARVQHWLDVAGK